MSTFKVGVIGLGGMGQMMLADMALHDRFSVVTAWDPNARTCDEVLARTPGLRIAASADDLIADPEIDLLYVASPPNSHRTHFLSALEAKVAVLCEKPFGVDLAQSEELVALIQQAGAVNIINFNHGNALGSTHIEEQMKSGGTGEIAGIDILVHLTQWPRAFQTSATWLGLREQGGFTREMLSHWLYLTRRLLGDGEIHHARVVFPEDGISSETHLTAELNFGGVPVFIRVTTGGAGPVGTECTIWGTKRSYRLHSGGRISTSDGGPWTPEFANLKDIGDQDRQRALDGVVSCLTSEPNNMPTAADGYAVQKLIEGLLTYRNG